MTDWPHHFIPAFIGAIVKPTKDALERLGAWLSLVVLVLGAVSGAAAGWYGTKGDVRDLETRMTVQEATSKADSEKCRQAQQDIGRMQEVESELQRTQTDLKLSRDRMIALEAQFQAHVLTDERRARSR